MGSSARDGKAEHGLPRFERQLRCLHYAEPLLWLDLHRNSLCPGKPDLLKDVDLLYVSLGLIVFLMEKRAIDLGAEREEILDYLARLVGAMRPDLPGEEGREAGEIVLGALMNRQEGFGAFQMSLYDPAAGFKPNHFRLVELDNLDGRNIYQATNEAIVLYLAMLDVDPAIAQRAEEMMLKYLVDAGRFRESVDLARQAHARSLQYQQRIQQRILEATRAPESVPWVRDVIPELRAAAEHVSERRHQERLILDAVFAHQEHSTEETAPALRELHVLLEDCQSRHSRLHQEILTANDRFLEAQARVFRSPRAQAQHDLEREVFPLLAALPVEFVAEHADALTTLLSPPRPPSLLNLERLFDALVRPGAPEELAESSADEYVDLGQHQDPFPPDLIREVLGYLGALLGRSPSIDIEEILVRARSDGLSVQHRRCAAFLLLQAYHPAANPFNHDVTVAAKQNRFEADIALGTRLLFTARRSP